MRPQGQQIIASLASKLAPTQQNKIMVSGYTDNAPIGPALARQGAVRRGSGRSTATSSARCWLTRSPVCTRQQPGIQTWT